jgi:triacylglycerol esterase/lipase EstA (alpha/beta hydrolase family)
MPNNYAQLPGKQSNEVHPMLALNDRQITYNFIASACDEAQYNQRRFKIKARFTFDAFSGNPSTLAKREQSKDERTPP